MMNIENSGEKKYMVKGLVKCEPPDMLDGFVIKSARDENKKDIYDFLSNNGLDNVTKQDVIFSLKNMVKNCFVIVMKGDEIVGCVVAEKGFFNIPDKNSATIQHFAVDKRYRRIGIGTTLIKNLKYRVYNKGIKNLAVCSYSNNEVTMFIYKKEGFVVFSKKKPGK